MNIIPQISRRLFSSSSTTRIPMVVSFIESKTSGNPKIIIDLQTSTICRKDLVQIVDLVGKREFLITTKGKFPCKYPFLANRDIFLL